MGRLFELVDAYRGRFEPHPPSYSRIAEQVGVSRQTLLNWRQPKELLDKDFLIALSRVTGAPYSRVLDALLDDIGYLHEEQEPVSKKGRRATKVDVIRPDFGVALAADEGDDEPEAGVDPDDSI